MESSHLVIFSTSAKFITKFNVLRCISLSETLFWTGARGGIPITLNAVRPAWCKRYYYITNRNKRSVFLLTDHFVIDECKLCDKEWKPLAMV